MKLNLKLYRSLLQSDFFLMKNNINNKLSSVSILDIPSLLVNIKQLIRIFGGHKKYYCCPNCEEIVGICGNKLF